MLKERGSKRPKVEATAIDGKSVGEKGGGKPVQARGPNHVWQSDLTLVSTTAGFWVPWLPFAIAQRWPFAWWIVCIVYSKLGINDVISSSFLFQVELQPGENPALMASFHSLRTRNNFVSHLLSLAMWPERLHAGPLDRHIDSFADNLREKGYARSFARYKLRLVGKLSTWLERRRLGVGDLNSEIVERFLASRKRSGRLLPDDSPALKQLLVHLGSKGVIASAQRKISERPIDRIGRTFMQYLEEERSVVDSTVKHYLSFIRQFLLERFGADTVELSMVEGKDILAFVARHEHPDTTAIYAKVDLASLRTITRPWPGGES